MTADPVVKMHAPTIESEARNPAPESAFKPRPCTDPIDLGDVLAALERIEAILGEQSAAVFSRKLAARYLGISPASLDRLAASVPELRPIHPTPGRSVWRKVDLQKYLDQL